ncbi:MAG: MFS transporter [Anaerolineaceae bacterium]|nr:MFS transporter [Anaerolineaceae bacterium]
MNSSEEKNPLVNPASPAKAGRQEWIGLAVLMLPTLLIAMDLTVLHLAVPSLSAALQPSSAELLWIVDIYGFMIAGSLITMGTLGDRIGRRKLLLLGAAAFGVASTIAAFAPSAELLIAARALLGVAGATLMPSTMSLIRNMFLDSRQRTAAIGIWVSGFSVGSAIGPLVGGLLLEYFWWGSVFLLGVPVMVVLLIAGPMLLPEHRDPHPGRFDLLSAAMSLTAVLLIIYGLKQVAESGLGWLPLLTVALGLGIGFSFGQRQRRLADPLIDLRLFHVPAFSASLATYTLGIFASFGTFLFIAQYLQLVLGLSPLQAGLWSVPGAIAFIVGSNSAPKFVQRVRPAFLVAGGLTVAAFCLGLLTQIGLNSLALIVFANTLMSLGFGVTFTLTLDMVVSAAPPERAGAASALAETGAELGGALGIAVLGSLATAVYRTQVTANLPPTISAEMAHAVRETLGGAVAAAGQLSGPLGPALLEAANNAFVSGLQVISLIGAVVMLGLALLTVTMLRHVEIVGEAEESLELETEGLVVTTVAQQISLIE